jgi:hypothetical protein
MRLGKLTDAPCAQAETNCSPDLIASFASCKGYPLIPSIPDPRSIVRPLKIGAPDASFRVSYVKDLSERASPY